MLRPAGHSHVLLLLLAQPHFPIFLSRWLLLFFKSFFNFFLVILSLFIIWCRRVQTMYAACWCFYTILSKFREIILLCFPVFISLYKGAAFLWFLPPKMHKQQSQGFRCKEKALGYFPLFPFVLQRVIGSSFSLVIGYVSWRRGVSLHLVQVNAG